MTFAQLGDCLWSVGLMKFPRGDPAVAQLTTDIISNLGHIKTRPPVTSAAPTTAPTMELASALTTSETISPLSDGMSAVVNVLNPLQGVQGMQGVQGVTDKALASILNGLVHTGAKWSSLPPASRELLLSRVVGSVFMPAIERKQYGYLPDVVWSLGKLSVELRLLKGEFRKVLMQAIVAVTTESPYYSAGDDGGSSSDSSSSNNNSSQSSSSSNGVNDSSSRSHSVSASRLVYGLSLMGAKWHGSATSTIASTSALSDPAKRALLIALTHHWARQDMSEMTLVNALYALGKMDCPYATLTVPARSHLVADLVRVVDLMGPAAVGNVLWALGKMRARWGGLGGLRGAVCGRVVGVSP
jgi:hypothetical protein